jgi:hypothetical protein
MTAHKDFVSICRRRKLSPPIVKTSGILEVAALAAHTDGTFPDGQSALNLAAARLRRTNRRSDRNRHGHNVYRRPSATAWIKTAW